MNQNLKNNIKNDPNFTKPVIKRITIDKNPLTKILWKATIEYEKNYPNKLEFSLPEYTIRNGIRWSVYHRYLKTAFYRLNLNILLNTRVQKVR